MNDDTDTTTEEATDTSGFESPPTTRAEELESGIFTLVVTLCRLRSDVMPASEAQEGVAKYLEELAAGLRSIPDNQIIKDH